VRHTPVGSISLDEILRCNSVADLAARGRKDSPVGQLFHLGSTEEVSMFRALIEAHSVHGPDRAAQLRRAVG
jgi:hypothetical protein